MIVIVTDVDEGLPPGISVDVGAVENSEDNVGLAPVCETLLGVRDELAGEAVLDWSGETPVADWDGVTVSGSPLRVTGLDLRDRGLTGEIPPALTGLTGLWVLRLSQNELIGCVPDGLRCLAASDLDDLDMLCCDVVLPHRWVVERMFAWLVRNRRLSKDYEFLPETEEAFVYAAMIRLMLRRLESPT